MKIKKFQTFMRGFLGIFVASLVMLVTFKACADSFLWTNGILNVPTVQGSGLATVAYDGDAAFFWLSGDVQGGQGYLAAGQYVAGLLAYNNGQVGPDYIRFYGSSPLVPATDYRLMTAQEKVAPGALVPEAVFESAPFSLQGGRLTSAMAIPEPGIGALLILGLVIITKHHNTT